MVTNDLKVGDLLKFEMFHLIIWSVTRLPKGIFRGGRCPEKVNPKVFGSVVT